MRFVLTNDSSSWQVNIELSNTLPSFLCSWSLNYTPSHHLYSWDCDCQNENLLWSISMTCVFRISHFWLICVLYPVVNSYQMITLNTIYPVWMKKCPFLHISYTVDPRKKTQRGCMKQVLYECKKLKKWTTCTKEEIVIPLRLLSL